MLVMASSILGIITGVIAAFSMVAQFTAFNGLPPMFYFPSTQLLVIFICSIACALLSTIGPSRAIVKNKIA